MTATLLVLLPPEPAASTVVLRVDADGRVVDRHAVVPGAVLPGAPADSGARVVLGVPGGEVTCAWLPLTAHSEAQARAASRLQLAPRLATPVEALHVAVAATADGHRLVAACTDAAMRGWLQRAATLGLRPDVVLPDCLLLPAPADDDTTIAVVVDGGRWLCRGAGLAFTAEATLAAVVLADQETRQVTEGAETLLARGAVAPPAIDLLQGPHALRVAHAATGPTPRRLAWLGAALLLSVPLLVAADALRYTVAAQRLDAEALALAAGVLPAGDVATPAAALAALEAWRAPDAQAAARATLFAAVAARPGVRLSRLLQAPGSGLQATVHHADADALAALRATLASQRLQLDDTGSDAADGGLRTDVVLSPVAVATP